MQFEKLTLPVVVAHMFSGVVVLNAMVVLMNLTFALPCMRMLEFQIIYSSLTTVSVLIIQSPDEGGLSPVIVALAKDGVKIKIVVVIINRAAISDTFRLALCLNILIPKSMN